MKISSRRGFLGTMALVAPFAALLKSNAIFAQKKGMFIHHVYFWLKNPSSNEDLQALTAGLQSLQSIEKINLFHVGKPADTNREVIDVSYALSLLMVFANRADQDNYQVHPTHLKFVETCKHLWSKVIVYDSVDV